MFDDVLAALETPTASIVVERPDEIALYARMFDILSGSAVYGAPARARVLAAVDELARRSPGQEGRA